MEKFTVYIDMNISEIRKGYKHFYGKEKSPTKKDIANWIANLAMADIQECASHEDDEEID